MVSGVVNRGQIVLLSITIVKLQKFHQFEQEPVGSFCEGGMRVSSECSRSQ